MLNYQRVYIRIWVNYNDLTATSLEWWLVRGIIPIWSYFRLVSYHNLPRKKKHTSIYKPMCKQCLNTAEYKPLGSLVYIIDYFVKCGFNHHLGYSIGVFTIKHFDKDARMLVSKWGSPICWAFFEFPVTRYRSSTVAGTSSKKWRFAGKIIELNRECSKCHVWFREGYQPTGFGDFPRGFRYTSHVATKRSHWLGGHQFVEAWFSKSLETGAIYQPSETF